MCKFYLNMEFTNGILYLVDLIEIVFHSYVKIHYYIPKQQLTGITNRTIKQLGLPFGD